VSIEANRTDLVVVGCGIAGLSAAVSGLQGGLQVTLLERAPEAEFGGNTRWTEAYMRMKNDAEISDDFEEHVAANTGRTSIPTCSPSRLKTTRRGHRRCGHTPSPIRKSSQPLLPRCRLQLPG
jgi:glycine/D-amino acid oxidase-like deaminating enzyme